MNLEFLSELGLEEETAEKILEEYHRECRENEFSNHVQQQLKQAGAKSFKAVMALLDLNDLNFDEEGSSEVSRQISSLKEEYPYLFQTDLPRVVASTPGAKKTECSLFSVIRSAAGLQ